MCQGLGPKKHNEISEIDRMCRPARGKSPMRDKRACNKNAAGLARGRRHTVETGLLEVSKFDETVPLRVSRDYGQFSKIHVCFCGLDSGN